MKDVYEKTPQMGDPASLEPRITETLNNIERLKLEVQKYEVREDPGEGWGPAGLAESLPGGGGDGDREVLGGGGAPAVSHHSLGCAWVISGNFQAQNGLTPEPCPGIDCVTPSSQAWLAEAESRVLSNRGDSLGRHTRPPDPPASAPPDSSSSNNSGSQDNKER